MKNMKKILFITMVTALLVGSCTKSDDEILSSKEMRFAAEFSSKTRATGSEFEVGDAMGIFVTQYENELALPLQISGNYANNSKEFS